MTAPLLEVAVEEQPVFNQRDRAIMRALRARPELPDGNIFLGDDLADHALVCKWHADAWRQFAEAK